ncbi:MAG: hypothetical protein J5I90_04910 [Caldilineales bacterium]|nr:hypothetical protein [Caldilineales bacterium]
METIANKTLEPIADMLNHIDVKSVFGEPTSEGANTIIPVAQLMYGFGYGFGGDNNTNSGGGGGAGGRATPRGYIRVGEDGVSYTPANNETMLGIMGMLTGIWSIFWIAVTLIVLIKSLSGEPLGEEEVFEELMAEA